MRAVLLLVLAALPTSPARPPAPQDGVRVVLTDAQLPSYRSREPRAQQVVRIVDGVTGEPLPGAELFRIAEGEHPLAGAFEFAERAVADEHGFARTGLAGHWTLARAEGHGPGMDMVGRDRVLPLARALDVPVLVRDWRGLPMPGQVVGWCGGCGHTPDLQTAATGADGVAWLRGIDPGNGISDLYVAHAPIAFDYDRVDWSPGDPPDVHTFEPGAVLSGVVLEPDGTPARGAFVGHSLRHRGPWALTGEDGRFVLGGLEPGSEFVVAHGGREVGFLWPARTPCRLQLPPATGAPYVDAEPEPEGDRGVLRFTFAPDELEPKEIGVRARGPLPGAWLSHADGAEELELVAGRYEVSVRHQDFYEVVQEIEVVAERTNDVSLQLQRLPTVVLKVERLPEEGKVWLQDSSDEREITAEVRAGTPVPVDPGAEYCVVLSTKSEQRRFACTGLALLDPALPPFRWYAPTRVLARLVDERGAPVAADVALIDDVPLCDVAQGSVQGFDPRSVPPQPCADGRVALETELERGAQLWIAPRDAKLWPRLVTVPMPLRGDDARADLGDVVLSTTPRLRLLAQDGSPFRGGLALLRTGRAEFREPSFEVYALAEDGSWLGPDLRPGDGLLVPASEEPGIDDDGVPSVALPFRHEIRGDGPHTLRVPRGSLDLEVHDGSGAPLAEVTVLMRECLWPAEEGRLRIEQVGPGEHRLFLAAEGRESAIVDVRLGDGQRRSVRVALPAR